MSRIVARIPQAGGGVRVVLAQDAQHARRARRLLVQDPAMIDHLHGVDGIRITTREVQS